MKNVVEEMTKKKCENLNMRLDDATAKRLEEIMQARGLNKTDAVKHCIHNIPILHLGDVKNLALEFCKIRVALESDCVTEEIRQEVKQLCQCTCDLVAKVERLEE